MSVSVVIKNAASTTGEGPHWDDKNNCLLYVDILANDVHKWDATTQVDTKVHLEDSVGFVVPRKTGGYVVGLGRTLSTLDFESGTTRVLHEVEQGTKNRFNDGKSDPSGRLWAGTMGYETVPAHPELEMGSLYSLETDGRLRSHLNKINISNGLAWSGDHRTMYYIDSLPRKVYVFDFDMDPGTPSNQRACVDFAEFKGLGVPDGMCIDVEDKIWVACYNGGKVVRFDPETGKELLSVKFPANRTTSCCFGGPNLDELYVTCGRHGLSEEDFRNKEPLAGSVFKVTGLGVKGLPGTVYNG